MAPPDPPSEYPAPEPVESKAEPPYPGDWNDETSDCAVERAEAASEDACWAAASAATASVAVSASA